MNSATTQECCICLQAAQTRNGFEFLMTPGCCGKWFHQSCLTDYMSKGGKDCPHCRTAFPAGALPPTPAPAPAPLAPPLFGLLQQQQGGLFQGFQQPPQVIPFGGFQQPQQPQQPQQVNPFGSNFALGAPGPASIFQFGARGRRAAPLADPTLLAEDHIIVDVEKPSKQEKTTKMDVEESSSSPQCPLTVTLTPEFPVEGLGANNNFHVRVSVQYEDLHTETTAVSSEERNPLDVVCVVDNSGSMGGEKIANLNKALEYIVSVLNHKDRMSIVTFNSSATLVMGLKQMNGNNKSRARSEVIPSIVADGGTDIYDGLKTGYNVLQGRLTKNPTSIMFLLTDGQDRSRLEEKKRIARQMRAEGTALFVFGFGADHDSQHMAEIANACEGSFIYIDTNDTVIDAFGGAIGSQQGVVLRNINVNLATFPNPSGAAAAALRILSIKAGSYPQNLNSSGSTGAVSFSDLFCGEKRDFIVVVSIPAVDSETNNYRLLSSTTSFLDSSTQQVVTTSTVVSSIQRSADLNQVAHLRVRDLLVDADIFRLRCTEAISTAIAFADQNNFAQAKTILDQAKNALVNESISFKRNNPTLLGMLQDLDDCLKRTTSREEYQSRGGRATLSEHLDCHSKQRKLYSKSGMTPTYQTSRSAVSQSVAMASKTPTPTPPPSNPSKK